MKKPTSALLFPPQAPPWTGPLLLYQRFPGAQQEQLQLDSLPAPIQTGAEAILLRNNSFEEILFSCTQMMASTLYTPQAPTAMLSPAASAQLNPILALLRHHR